MIKKFFIFLIRVYQIFISPLQIILYGSARTCRFFPGCSEYARESFQKHNAGKAVVLVIKRILRCYPFAKGGYDPVR